MVKWVDTARGPASTFVMSSVSVPDVGHAMASPFMGGNTMFVIVSVVVELAGVVVVPVEIAPLMCTVPRPFSTCVLVSNPLNVMSCCWSIVSVPLVLPVSVNVPAAFIFVRTAAVVLGSNCDCGLPDASSRVYDCVTVSPFAMTTVGQVKLCDDAL